MRKPAKAWQIILEANVTANAPRTSTPLRASVAAASHRVAPVVMTSSINITDAPRKIL